MVRAVVQLTDEQFSALNAMSARQRRPVEELVREGVESLLAQRSTSSDARRRALAASGRFRSGLRNLARQHNRYLVQSDR